MIADLVLATHNRWSDVEDLRPSQVAAIMRIVQKAAKASDPAANDPPPMNEADFMRRFGGGDIRVSDLGG